MTEQQQWLAYLCGLVGYSPSAMGFAGQGLTFTTPDLNSHTVSISDDGLWVVGDGWRVRVHDEQLPLSFRRAVESGRGDLMSDEQATLRLLQHTGTE